MVVWNAPRTGREKDLARLSTRTAPIDHSQHVLISETTYRSHSQSCIPSMQQEPEGDEHGLEYAHVPAPARSAACPRLYACDGVASIFSIRAGSQVMAYSLHGADTSSWLVETSDADHCFRRLQSLVQVYRRPVAEADPVLVFTVFLINEWIQRFPPLDRCTVRLCNPPLKSLPNFTLLHLSGLLCGAYSAIPYAPQSGHAEVSARRVA